jgi:hypothetical protein
VTTRWINCQWPANSSINRPAITETDAVAGNYCVALPQQQQQQQQVLTEVTPKTWRDKEDNGKSKGASEQDLTISLGG